MKIETLNDAEVAVNNSGFNDMEFGGTASIEGLIEFVYRNVNSFDRDYYEHHVINYLISENENPADYGLA